MPANCSGATLAIENVLKDINVGVNGSLDLGYKVAGVSVSMPVGQATAYFSGFPSRPFSSMGRRAPRLTTGVENAEPVGQVILNNFQVNPGGEVSGYFYRDGRFSVSVSSNYKFFFANAALTVTVTDHDITASRTG